MRRIVLCLRHCLPMFMAVAIIGCSRNPSKQYFPEQAVGTRQQYDLVYRAPFGQVGNATMISSVDGEEKINGKTYYREIIAFSGLPGASQKVTYARWSSQGIYQIDGDHKNDPEYLATPFPLEVGSKWVSHGPEETDDNQVVGIETVELPGQSYKDCLKVSSTTTSKSGSKMTVTEYLGRGVGLVKTDVNGGPLGVSFSITLRPDKK